MNKIIKEMTLEDKIALCSGKDFWQTKSFEKYGIPSIFMSDGPHGLRKQDVGKGTDMLGVNKSFPATCFPSEVTTASSFDTELLEEIGSAIGKEAKQLNVALTLGPGANIKRNPLCGRNFEYFSEDPYVSGKLAASFIKGIEKEGIGSSLKHFACNSQEFDRFTSNSVLSDRALREIYLKAFEIAVKEGKPSTVMCAYPKLNDVHCSDNKLLLNDILRDEWGFDGIVVTDWGAMNNRIKGFRAGCDLNMPGGSDFMEKDVKEAVYKHELDEECIDKSVDRILNFVLKDRKSTNDDCHENNHNIALKAALKGAVLLKNDDKILPLDLKSEKVGIVGYMAKHMRYQGSGSSHINPTKLSNPLDCFKDLPYALGCDENGNTNDDLLDEVSEVASSVDKVVIFAGLPDKYESEGFDREDMKMPLGHLKMIDEAIKHNKNVIVVLLCGSPVECPWADDVKGILYMGLPGQAGGEASYKLLTGNFNPCGKLAETWPKKYEDVITSEFYGKKKDALYKEGIYVGYRYYDKANIEVRFPFSYGLSYTEFAYSNLKISNNVVSVDVTNIGDLKGEETILLFVSKKQEGIHRPLRELKRFKKIELNPKETKIVTFKLDNDCFEIYHDGFVIEKGDYEININDLSGVIHVNGQTFNEEDNWYFNFKGDIDKSFEHELGRKYEEPILKKGSFTMDNTVEEMKDYSLIMKIMYKSTEKVIAKQFGGKVDYDNPEFKMMMKCSAGGPLRNMQISGGIKGGVFEGLLLMANGHFFKGLFKMLEK